MHASSIVDFLLRVHPLDRVPRSGFLLRGVTEPESVAAHSHTLSLIVELVCLGEPGKYDSAKALAMAVVHDLPEVITMDIPMPAGSEAFRAERVETERAIMRDLCPEGFSGLAAIYEEYLDGSTSEARLVRGLDKVQMMVKVLAYEREGRGRLEEFWTNPANFRTYGIEVTAKLFDEIASRSGRSIPGRGAAEASVEGGNA